ncbi:MAG: hypothetical protein J6K96_11640 [Treponema sp.]|nr:hypothetical protein [Treponema sp.]
MGCIRKAEARDASRLAEILIFTKRMAYRKIFCNDKVSFGEMQVYPLAQDYIAHPERLRNIRVYDDEFVKGMVHVEGKELTELYVDSFFQNEGIGSKLLALQFKHFIFKLCLCWKKYRCNPILSASWFFADKRTAIRRRHGRICCKDGTMNFCHAKL